MEVPRIPVTMSSKKKYSALEILQFTVLTCIVLYFGRTLFIPLSFAMLISFILYPLCKGMEKKGINKVSGWVDLSGKNVPVVGFNISIPCNVSIP